MRTRTSIPEGDNDDFVVEAMEYLPPPPPGYDLLGRLGAGGMARVFLAREHAAERTVAIKFLNSPSSGTMFERFLVEARSLARLEHPNIVKVIHVETNWREPFLTMEYAEGGTLAELVQTAIPPPAEAARLMLAAAEGVAAAHARNILHRDLKPSNILLSGTGPAWIPKVSDFGLAKRTDRDEGLTRTGVIGTPAYMSPEAAAGHYRDVGMASDVYGLGATLYFLLTGQAPFTASEMPELLRQVQHDSLVRPRSVRPDVPVELEAIALKAMEKKAAKRYQTAAAFADDVRRYLAGEQPAAPLHSRRRQARQWLQRRRRRLAVAVGLVLVAVGLVIGGSYFGAPPDPAPVAPTAPPDPVAAIKADAATGKKVTLIGETGRPTYQRTLLEPNAIGESPQGDKTCAFHAFDTCLLELGPDLGLDHYRVSFQIRQLVPKSGSVQNATDSIGVYFGYGSGFTANNTTVHAMFAVTFKDYERPGDPKNLGLVPVFLQRRGFTQKDDRLLALAPGKKGAGLRFKPAASRPGDWRLIVLELSTTEIHIQWKGDKVGDEDGEMKTLARWPADKAIAEYRGLKQEMDPMAPGASVVLPEWSPRMPFGILAAESSVAVKNVVFEPLP